MPMLAVSFAILIAAVATYDSSPSRFELYAIASSSIAIPFLAMSVFIRKGVAVVAIQGIWLQLLVESNESEPFNSVTGVVNNFRHFCNKKVSKCNDKVKQILHA